ncbi:MAG TPA: hypothetical protein VLJ86_08890 [Ramlibacter sp.]|nr:hypothetical protein [Ramlibacter sp.]
MRLRLPHLPTLPRGWTRRPAATLEEALAPTSPPWIRMLRRFIRKHLALGFAVVAAGALIAAIVIIWFMHSSVMQVLELPSQY